MSKFTENERNNYKRLIGSLMKGDPARKTEFDAKTRKVIAAMHESMPTANDEMLAEFASAVGYIATVLMRAPTGDVSVLLIDLFNNYSLAVAQLIGVYDPASEEVPNYEQPDLAAALAGLDPNTIRKIETLISEQGSHDHSQRVADDDLYKPGMYL